MSGAGNGGEARAAADAGGPASGRSSGGAGAAAVVQTGASAVVPRPAPVATELSEGFWQGVREGRLVIQRCTTCGTLRHYPQPMCPACRALGFDWAPVSGRGEIYSYTVAHRAFHPAWQAHVPYAIATIELDEGVRMVCDLLGTPIDAVRIGARVEVCFEAMPGQGTMPRFRVVESAR